MINTINDSKPKVAINCTDILSFVCETVLSLIEDNFQYNSLYAIFSDMKSWIFAYSNAVVQWNSLESNFLRMTWKFVAALNCLH